jgi:crotonobetainyl-CoA:carnitine CoA-transferase CaiB-like acyl-CoA transferase
MADSGALAGIRVLDMSRVLAAPFAAQLLADLGADVIKVERRGDGDESRNYGPAFLTDREGRQTRESGFFLAANRNKRSIALDLSRSSGREVARDLIARCDVVIENFLPGVMARFGLDYPAMQALNSRLVYCSLTGYGQDGPYSERPGYDAVFQSQSGMMALTGAPDDERGAGPMRVGLSIVDLTAGYNAAVAILAALMERERHSGLGQYIDVALLDSAVAVQSHALQNYLLSGQQPPRAGSSGSGGHPARIFACKDGDLYISAGNQQFYRRLCEVLGLTELINDPQFCSIPLRYENRVAWNVIAEPVISQWNKQALLDALVAARVPASIVSNYDELFADPHVIHRKLKQTMPHPLSPTGEIAVLASPTRLSRTPPGLNRSPPLLGEHSEEILRELLGADDARIAALREDGTI